MQLKSEAIRREVLCALEYLRAIDPDPHYEAWLQEKLVHLQELADWEREVESRCGTDA